ncbi:MAG TPA: hypothetical protein VGD84_20490 [Pseudonocardiaceae bacterium]
MRRSGEPTPALIVRASEYFKELGLAEHTMENEVLAAMRRAQSGDMDSARRQLTNLLSQADSAESRAQVCLALARLEWRAERLGSAREHARVGLTETPTGRSTPPYLTASLLGLLAHVDVAEGLPDDAVQRLNHPAVRLMLTWDTPVAAEIALVVATIELCRDRPERAGRLLGAATVLGERDDLDDMPTITQRVTAALGTAGFTAAHAAGTAMSRAMAEDLVSAIITAPGVGQRA